MGLSLTLNTFTLCSMFRSEYSTISLTTSHLRANCKESNHDHTQPTFCDQLAISLSPPNKRHSFLPNKPFSLFLPILLLSSSTQQAHQNKQHALLHQTASDCPVSLATKDPDSYLVQDCLNILTQRWNGHLDIPPSPPPPPPSLPFNCLDPLSSFLLLLSLSPASLTI